MKTLRVCKIDQGWVGYSPQWKQIALGNIQQKSDPELLIKEPIPFKELKAILKANNISPILTHSLAELYDL